MAIVCCWLQHMMRLHHMSLHKMYLQLFSFEDAGGGIHILCNRLVVTGLTHEVGDLDLVLSSASGSSHVPPPTIIL